MLSGLPTGPVRTSFATAELVARDTGVLLLLDGAESSFLDLRDPAHLDFEYHQQMDAVLAAQRGESSPVKALHLGGAGCALARAWDVTRPGSQQLAVEIDEILAHQVRTWFDLPRSPRLRIRVGDAAEVVSGLRPGQWDVVVRDVFNGGSVPAACRCRCAPGPPMTPRYRARRAARPARGARRPSHPGPLSPRGRSSSPGSPGRRSRWPPERPPGGHRSHRRWEG